MSFGPFFEGEQPRYTFTLKDRDTGDVLDLTDYTAAKVMLRKKGASANRTGSEDGTFAGDRTTGVITYDLPSVWAAVDVGTWMLQVQVTDPNSKVRKTEKIRFPVESGLAPQ